MGSINNILGMPPELSKSGNSRAVRKTNSGDVKEEKTAGINKQSVADKAEISSVGRELFTLKMQAAEYTEEVKKADTISQDEIDAIKEKIASNYYFDPEVIDKVVDKLIALPNY